MKCLSATDSARREKARASELKWRGMPPGLPPKMAERFERLISEGKTVADLTKSSSKLYICSYDRFKRHCELKPMWWRRVQKLNAASITKKKKRRNIGYALRTKKVCLKGLHPMRGFNVIVDKDGHRRCRACHYVAMRGRPMTAEMMDRIKAALVDGYPLARIVCGKPGSLKITTSSKLNYQREIDPEFGRFVDKYIEASNAVGQTLRHAKDLPAELRPAVIKLARLKHKVRTIRQSQGLAP